ncbi:MAG: ABC transporter substrate-binding protein [Lachnospiraceae bacterium]|nr:ABC transporter substrate-binding protein [Lachnospiraceae bacterium]
MKKISKMLALLLAAVMVFTLAACSGSGTPSTTAAPAATDATEAPADDTTEAPTEEEVETEAPREMNADTPLVVGYSPFSSKFSPFFSETAYDQDVYAMTQLSLLSSDRMGAIIYNGIEGETIEYNGTPYTYHGPADLVVTENEDGTVFYDFTLREDLVFSDGEPLTIDDVIFTMYVLCDPTYDGSSTLFAQPIEGMADYRTGIAKRITLIAEAGRDNTDFTFWTQEQQDAYWKMVDEAPAALAQEICDYCWENGYAPKEDVSAAAGAWGFSVPEGGTIEDFAAALVESYGDDIIGMIDTENAGSSVADFLPDYDAYEEWIEYGESAANITGIQKTGDYSMRIVATEVDATMVYQLGVSIAPLHYYGDVAQYDYDNNMFGFPKGDLSIVKAKTTEPLGAGKYKFIKFENGVVNFEANENYYEGVPKTKYINFREVQDTDKLNGVKTGTLDITDPSFSSDTVAAIIQANGNDDVTGPVITTNTVDNLGYGYIGINAHNVKVGEDPSSDASKNLRKAFATIFSVYRDVAIDSYYGERASVINYPISNTSWAAPQPTDDGYRLAFSTDVNGLDIYTSDMDADAKYAAAKAAALGFFEAAGYTVADGKVTAAPEGAKMEYEALIPGDGAGDHPSFMILTLAHDALAELGINLIVTDLTNSADLWTTLEADQGEIWCAAWGATVDPDMYQVYYSDVANGGANAGGSHYMYNIDDPDLDEMIMAARKSTDQTYRKTVYKACLDTIIDWACEIPVYQRQNAIVFSTERVNIDTVTPDITTFYGWMSEIENTVLNY